MFVAALALVGLSVQCDEDVAPVMDTLSVVAAAVLSEVTRSGVVTARVKPLEDRVKVIPAPAVRACGNTSATQFVALLGSVEMIASSP